MGAPPPVPTGIGHVFSRVTLVVYSKVQGPLAGVSTDGPKDLPAVALTS